MAIKSGVGQPQQQQPQTVTFKRGESIFRVGDRVTAIYLLQSGAASVRLERDGNIELYVATAPQCVGDEVIYISGSVGYGAFALKDTTALKIPLDLARREFEAAPHSQKTLIKGYAERIKTEISDLKTVQGNRGNSHCPPTTTARLFGTIFHVAKELGAEQGGLVTLSWQDLRNHATTVYHESALRLEQGLFILAKLGYADIVWENPGERLEGTREPKTVYLRNMVQIETFFEFYQNYLYKPGAASILKTNDKLTAITTAFLKVADDHPVQRDGMVRMPYKESIDQMKKILGTGFEADQLFRLEQKGLMVKRTSSENGATLSFLRAEFEQMLLTWKLLKEIEQWNESGFVDLGKYAPPTSPPTAAPQTAAPAVDHSRAMNIADLLARWVPAVVAKKVPQIRTDAPAPGEKLCATCMSALGGAKDFCPICDTPIQSGGSQAA